MQVVVHQLVGLFGGVGALTGFDTEEFFGSGEEGKSPSVFTTMLVQGIDKVFGDDAACHLETGDVVIELAAHLASRESASVAEVAGDEAALFVQRGEDGILNRSLFGNRVLGAPPVKEVGPPLAADKARLACKELAIDATALLNDRPFPLPQRPLPSAIGEYGVAAFFRHQRLGAVTPYAALQQRQKAHLLDALNQFWAGMYLVQRLLFVPCL